MTSIIQVLTIPSGKVSLDRVNDFLRNTELRDTFSVKPQDQLIIPSLTNEDDREIGFIDAVFSWSTDSEDDNLPPSLHSFKLRVNGELLFKHGCINLIIGLTGCGKTSMLMALLVQRRGLICLAVVVWRTLHRNHGCRMRRFAKKFSLDHNWTNQDIKKACNLIRQCALEKDLELFEAGEQTEVGERVVVRSSKQIVENCFKRDLIKGRTIIMVTHSIALTSPIADFVMAIGLNGTVTSQSSDISIALDSDPSLAQELAEEEEKLQKMEEEVVLPKKEAKADGKLMIAEEIVEGHVSWKSVKLFLSSLSGIVFESAVSAFQIWFLGFWGSQYEQHASSEIRVGFYLGAYSGTMGIVTVIYGMTYLYYALGSLRASKVIHENLVESILSSTLRWLDETPTSRIIARCTQDIRAVEGPIARWFSALADLVTSSLVKLSVIVLYSPVFIYSYIGNIYLKAQMSVKREMSTAKTPVLAHLGASIADLFRAASIRTYSAEGRFKTESLRRIDHYTRIARTPYNLNRWIAIRIDALGAIFTGSLTWYPVYRRSTGPEVLHDISFNIRSEERVGAVRRTGSGKSSLTLALLQCILTEGNVFYDGIPTNNLNLDALRDLDPFEKHDDATLNAALRDAGLFSLQTENCEGRITLDTKIASSRTIVRESKVLILDEATSAINYQTDAIIQKTLRHELGTDVTILTVAHRLQTIMDADKIMVLENGCIIKFDSPKVLLTREDSKLRALVDESGDKATLYEMAQND
ncbi:hypothetical protein BDQ12DRAFT_761446 [Crucibulum laeve]|uniref:P-loop containing nucleoside triphosphate hydrolase protein n=1 Tax=Crucibulum laeve TaxID=68775 RepID=A0A5C3LNQ5_9AGAR|nr:hypothetical protein BDQ12DRAFT_761446 [Crucibulum laeve]